MLPPGSEARLNRLSNGKFPLDYKVWPNGAKKDVVFPPLRLKVTKKGFVPRVHDCIVSSTAGLSKEAPSSLARFDAVASATVCRVPTFRISHRAFFGLRRAWCRRFRQWQDASEKGV